MKWKLIVCDSQYGHVELMENEKVKDGKYKGLSQEELFTKIMQSGYGGKLPAVFMAELKDGSIEKYTGKDAKALIDNPMVSEVTVIAPIAGGSE